MDVTKFKQLESIVFELTELYKKIQNHITEQTSAESYVYADTYRGWVTEYNVLIKKYNQLTSANLSIKNVTDYELSSTQKTARNDVAKSFAQAVKDLSEKIESEINAEQNKENPIPMHQMRVCFKIGAKRCPLNPPENKNKIFVAMPFDNDYKDSYEYGIKLILTQKSIDHFKADNEIKNKDMMCKICKELQSCGRIIANISGLNPNVMLELGLAYGLGKEVIIIKDKKTTAVSDLGGIEYIEYSHAVEIQQELNKIL